MRILYHHRTLGDGAEGVHIHEMIEAFRRLGHEVEVNAIAGDRPLETGRRERLLTRLRSWTPDAAYEPLQAAHSLSSVASFARTLKAFAPDFVYKRHARYDFGPILACKQAAIPLILEVNTVYSSMSLRRFERVSFPGLLGRLEQWTFQNATCNIAVSRPLASEIRDLAPDADIVVMSNGVNLSRFQPGSTEGSIRRLHGLQGTVVVGFVGTLWKWHGLEMLLGAVHDLAQENLHLLVVGDGEMLPELRRIADALRLTSRVTFTGRVPHDRVPEYIAAMDVTILPAEHRAHASPMKILEYMAMGKPVVGPRLPNIEEILTDGQEGLLFTPDDRPDLARTLRRLVRDSALRSVLGRRGRLRVETDLNWDNNAAKVVALLQRDSSAPDATARAAVEAGARRFATGSSAGPHSGSRTGPSQG
jgi:glycosyltransferase involved in cell wall biosynthesis